MNIENGTTSYYYSKGKREGWIESKLRFLIGNLEQTPNVEFAHPYPSSFENKADPVFIISYLLTNDSPFVAQVSLWD